MEIICQECGAVYTGEDEVIPTGMRCTCNSSEFKIQKLREIKALA